MEGCAFTQPYPFLKEVYDALEQGGVVVVVASTSDSRVGMVVAYGLKGRFGIGEDTDPGMVLKCGEGGVNRDEFTSHDSASFLPSCCIYVDGGGGGNVYHCCSQSGMACNVGAIRVDPIFWDEFRYPWVRGWGAARLNGWVDGGRPC